MKFPLSASCVMVGFLRIAFGFPLDPALDEAWTSWKSFHRKQYQEENINYRRMVWEKNMRYIEQHNLEHSMGKHSFTVGMNQFGDLTLEEFKQLRLNTDKRKEVENSTWKIFAQQENAQLPPHVDWRPKGYVTPVKDQGQCGSCWAFSTTGVLEGQVFNKTGKLISLSEQYLMDCSRTVGNAGCNGGSVMASFAFIKDQGIASEQSYPYVAKNGDCKFEQSDIVATCKGVTQIRKDSEADLAAAVATVGPISAGIDAEHRSFMLYKSGIFYEPHCSTVDLDHGILVVGYGMENQKPYWIVKNREWWGPGIHCRLVVDADKMEALRKAVRMQRIEGWGSNWGNKGYVHMAKDMDNNCGIASNAVYPEV